MDTISDFYRLSKILNDDLYKVAHVIRSYHDPDALSDLILNDIQELNLVEYSDTISRILDIKKEAIIKASMGILFDDERTYIKYLQSLMDDNDLIYAPFVKRNLFD